MLIVSRAMNAAVEQIRYTMPTPKENMSQMERRGGNLTLRQSQAADKRLFNGLC